MAGWCVSEQGWKKGPWTPEEDKLLTQANMVREDGVLLPGLQVGIIVTYIDSLYVRYFGLNGKECSNITNVPQVNIGLNRSGKSCRLRWVNYLRPGPKIGHITPQEEGIIIELHALWGNKWSTIARYLPGRTDNEIKNYWRTHFKPRGKRSEKKKIFSQKEQNGGNSVQADPMSDVNIFDTLSNKQETVIPYPIVDNPFQPMIYQDITSCLDIIAVDEYLWGDLWNLDI